MKHKFLYIIFLIFSTSYMFSQTCNTGNCYEPIPKAGADKTYFQGEGEGLEIILDGSNSYDPDNSDCTLIYNWTSPSVIELVNGEDSSSPFIIAPLLNDFNVTCSNPEYDNESDCITDPNAIDIPEPGIWGICSSEDQNTEDDCLTAGEMWIAGDDGNKIAYIPIRLTVNDGEYNSLDYDEVIISIVETNTAPILDIELDYILNRLSEFTIDASSVSDENSLTGTLEFIWDYNDFIDFGGEIIDDSINSTRVFKTPNVSGDYIIGLSISDNYDSIDFEFTVKVLSFIPPVSALGEDLYITINSEVILDGMNSFDEDGEITNYTWNYSDCINVGFECEENCDDEDYEVDSPTVTLKAPGIADQTCQAILTVEDNDAPPNFSEEWAGNNLFISEYVEAVAANDSYFEIYNGTDSQVSLSEYSLRITQQNGNEYDLDLDDTSGDSINDGFLDPGDVLLIIKTDSGQLCKAGGSFLDCVVNGVQFIEWSSTNKMGGDDAVTLYHNDVLIDVIGTPGNDPGSGWTVGGVEDATKNHTLIRRSHIISGNLDWQVSSGNHMDTEYPNEAACVANQGLWVENDSYCNLSEWEVFDQNTFSYGGENNYSACDNYVNIKTVANESPDHFMVNIVPDCIDALDYNLTVKKDNTETLFVLEASAIDREGSDLNYIWTPSSTDVILSDHEIESSSGFCIDVDGDIENIECLPGINPCNVDDAVCGNIDLDDLDNDGSEEDLIETGCCNQTVKKTTSKATFYYASEVFENQENPTVTIECAVDDNVNPASEAFCSEPVSNLEHQNETDCLNDAGEWIDATITSISFDVNLDNEDPQSSCIIQERVCIDSTCDAWAPISDPSNINQCQGVCEDDNTCDPCQYSTNESTQLKIDCSESCDETSTGELIFNWSTPYLDVDANGANDLSFYNEEEVYLNDILIIETPDFVAEDRIFTLKLNLSDGDSFFDGYEKSFSFSVIAENPIIGNGLATGYVFDLADFNQPLGMCSNDEYLNVLDCLTDPNAVDEDGNGVIDVYPGIWGECSDNTYTNLSTCLYIDGISDQDDPDYVGPTGEQWLPYPFYEGLLLELEGSATDPNGNCSDPSAITQSSCINLGICDDGVSITEDECDGIWIPEIWEEDPLAYDWSFHPDETNTGTFYGVCLDIDGIAIDRSPCFDDGDCANTCSYDSHIAYLELPIHLQKDTEIGIVFETEDVNGNNSDQTEYTVTAIATYPVAHAGYDFEVVAGNEVSLMGYLSYDNQEAEVSLGSWDTSGDTGDIWEESGRKIIAYYSNYVSEPLTDYVFTWTQKSGNPVAMDLNAVNPTFTASNSSEILEFELQVTDPDGHISEIATVEVEIIQDEEPIVNAGPDFRAAGSNVVDDRPSFITLDGAGYCDDKKYGRVLDCINNDNSWIGTYDLTDKGTLTYQWISNPCSDGVSQTKQDCCINNQGTFENDVCYPCSKSEHDNEYECILDNGSWTDVIEHWNDDINIINNDNIKAQFQAPDVSHGQEITLSFTFNVINTIDGIENNYSDNLIVTIARPSTPISPALDARPRDGQIMLYWNSISEDESIDSLTHYADFQGYRLYKSTDYGETWGKEEDMLLSYNGDFLGWKPYKIFDYSEENDINYCLYTASDINENGEICDGSLGKEIRGEDGDISGFDPYQLWFDMGENSGLVNTFVDTNVIDGIDYTYTITAYDRGLKPINRESGSYDDLTGEWTTDEDHTFNQVMPAKEYILNRLDYTIEKSEIRDNVYVYILDVPNDYKDIIKGHNCSDPNYDNETDCLENESTWTPGYLGIAQIKDIWPSTNPDGYYIGMDDDIKQGYQSLESTLGNSDSDHNYIIATGGSDASDIEFPLNSDIDDFVSPDCRAIGNGTKKYEIVNLDELSKSLVKFEIQANSTVETFEGHATENACLYAFPVMPEQEEGFRPYYVPVYDVDCKSISDSDICDNTEECVWENNICSNVKKQYESIKKNGATYFLDLNHNGVYDADGNENISDYEGLPGIDIIYSSDSCPEYSYCLGYHYDNEADCLGAPIPGIWKNSEDCILRPDYLDGMGGFADDCFMILPSDDDDSEENFTDKIYGAIFRFDNAIASEPSDKVVELDEALSSHIDLGTPDNYLVDEILSDDFNGGNIELRFYSSFLKKPCYDYEIELGANGLSESLQPGAACPNNGMIGAQLPFRIKNKTTGKYVTLKHDDGGIFDGNPPPWWQGPIPGDGDCMWQPGEALFFQQDSVLIGLEDNVEWSAEKTYELLISYQIDQLVYSGYNPCSDYDYNYSDAESYEVGDCVYHEGMLWRATEGVEDSSYEPNEWDYNDDTGKNNNPWIAVYPWDAGDILTLNTVKNYVDEDYWIADMSLLGQSITLEDDGDTQSSIPLSPKVVPNPYMVYSNQSTDGIRFTHLPEQCTITIYTVSGEFVNILEHDGEIDGEYSWDLKNKHGVHIAPGLYIYQIMHPDFYSYQILTPKFGKDINKPYAWQNQGNSGMILMTGKFAVVK